MAVETNLIKKNDIARVRALDFALQFNGSLKKLNEVLGVTRKIAVVEGATLKALKVTGGLNTDSVAEGDIIPLSHYETTYTEVGSVVLNKWRKSTSAEAIAKGGYDQAVGATTDRMLKDIQKKIRTDFFAFLENGTGAASGATLQPALANAWGVSSVLWEDDAVEVVYFLNPLDVADYLGTAQVSLQTVFGMTYIENFLGLGTVILNSNVPQGKFYCTAKENIICYYINVSGGDIADRFELTTDESGYIGVSEYPDKDRACVNNLVMSGVTFFPERLDGIVVGEIEGAANPSQG